MENALGEIPVERRTGNEPLAIGDEPLPEGVRLLNFWQWMGSDLMDNVLRGTFGEYLVALAVGAANGVYQNWESYDVRLPDGGKIEVKTSAYIQTWAQSELYTPAFGIGPSTAWDAATNLWSTEKKRWADVYVFCLHHHQDRNSINPLDLSQWTFYVLPTVTLDREVGNQKSIRISSLQRIGAVAVSFDGLGQAITAAYNDGKASANINSIANSDGNSNTNSNTDTEV